MAIDKHMGLLLGPDRATAFSADVASDVAVDFARAILSRFDVDRPSPATENKGHGCASICAAGSPRR